MIVRMQTGDQFIHSSSFSIASPDNDDDYDDDDDDDGDDDDDEKADDDGDDDVMVTMMVMNWLMEMITITGLNILGFNFQIKLSW